MRASWMRVSGLVLMAVIAFGMIATGLQAGPAPVGKFKLPFDARLQGIALPTGDYTFSLDHVSGTVFIYRGNQAVGLVRAQVFDSHENQSENPALVCIRHDGNVTVRALRLSKGGTFYFSLPKELKALVAQQPQLIQTISVEVRGE
jgi:hypothetical protein